MKHSYIATTIPAENAETYKWRGDLGILDRLGYGDSGEIPRSWEMTNLDASAIAERQANSFKFATSSTQMITEDAHMDLRGQVDLEASLESAPAVTNGTATEKKKRYFILRLIF
jgi:hypothetical protein